jgi:hypothetical protein
MTMFRFAQVFVLIVATAWAVELTCCYLAKLRKRRLLQGTALDDSRVRVGLGTDRSELSGIGKVRRQALTTITDPALRNAKKNPPHGVRIIFV